MNKSPDAFRTISEVADFLETPAHVLRFWESRFPQIRPVKRAGGRRYYRPADVALLTGIKRLLHDEGMTIRGVQKILREQGVRHVSGLPDDAPEIEDDDALAAALAEAAGPADAAPPLPLVDVETAQIIALQAALRPPAEPEHPSVTAEPPEPSEDPPTEWQIDVMPEDADLPDLPPDMPPIVAAPPQPVTAAAEIPVISDLFARVPDPTPPVPAPPTSVEEAPMAVWADEPEPSPESAAPLASDPPPPVLKITRIGAAAAPVAPSPAPSPVEAPAPSSVAEPLLVGPTLAQRLRACAGQELAAEDRAQLARLRDQAVALRARLAGPARPIG